MHIPDGFLDTKTIVATSAFSFLGIARALRNVTRELSPRKIPLMGLAAAFVFVAQMLNFPVGGGTSGHLIGAVLVAVLLGPSTGILVMTVVLIVQCLLFADGGVLALGANIFNMGIIAVVGGYYIYRAVRSLLPAQYGTLVAAGFAAWASTVLAAICCAGELAWSGIVPWQVAFPAMTGIHMLIGVGEGLITTLIVAAIHASRPDLLTGEEPKPGRTRRGVTDLVLYGGLVVLGLALFVSPFASRWPDGLEKVAATFGFDSRAIVKPAVASPIAEYRVPGIGSLPAATAVAGAIGAAVVFLFSLVLARVLTARSKRTVS